MTWHIDYTSQAREDLVGLDAELSEAITDIQILWLAEGPPRQDERTLAGIRFFEATVAERVLIGYTVKDNPRPLPCCGSEPNRDHPRVGALSPPWPPDSGTLRSHYDQTLKYATALPTHH